MEIKINDFKELYSVYSCRLYYMLTYRFMYVPLYQLRMEKQMMYFFDEVAFFSQNS